MASADRPEERADTTSSLEFRDRFSALGKAIDDVLVANHTLRASLAADHLPFSASLAEATRRYGESRHYVAS
jgi:hypothetical protein